MKRFTKLSIYLIVILTVFSLVATGTVLADETHSTQDNPVGAAALAGGSGTPGSSGGAAVSPNAPSGGIAGGSSIGGGIGKSAIPPIGRIVSPGGVAYPGSNDPQDSGCWTDARIVNSGVASVDGYVVYGYNWYSQHCNTNWVEIAWSSGAAIQTQLEINTVANEQARESGNWRESHECYPVSCSGFYTGGLSPSWTDMVPGTDVTDVHLLLRAAGTGHTTDVIGWITA